MGGPHFWQAWFANSAKAPGSAHTTSAGIVSIRFRRSRDSLPCFALCVSAVMSCNVNAAGSLPERLPSTLAVRPCKMASAIGTS